MPWNYPGNFQRFLTVEKLSLQVGVAARAHDRKKL